MPLNKETKPNQTNAKPKKKNHWQSCLSQYVKVLNILSRAKLEYLKSQKLPT